MNKIFVPSSDINDWQKLLADPEKHWRPGYSAYALANSWQAANGRFPSEVGQFFAKRKDDRICDLEMLLAIPEWKVYLPPRGHASQNDLFVLAKGKQGLVTIMVEGKVAESFGETIERWLFSQSSYFSLILQIHSHKKCPPSDGHFMLISVYLPFGKFPSNLLSVLLLEPVRLFPDLSDIRLAFFGETI